MDEQGWDRVFLWLQETLEVLELPLARPVIGRFDALSEGGIAVIGAAVGDGLGVGAFCAGWF